MAKESWWNLFNIFSYAFAPDPLTLKRKKEPRGAAFTNPEAIEPRQGTDAIGSSSVRLRQTNDLVDISTVTNRLHRYKEYERLRNMAEIETAMTVFADEACVSGETQVATPHGFREIAEISRNEKDRFLVYCYDEEKEDFTLGWAHSARCLGRKKTYKIFLDDGNYLICTPDHKILMKNGEWKEAQDISEGDSLTAFYRIPAQQNLTKVKVQQFPRIYTNKNGWIHERQFIDEWATGTPRKDLQQVNQYCRMVTSGMSVREIDKCVKSGFTTVRHRLERAGFSNEELKWLGKRKDCRKVIACYSWDTDIDVYDITVEKYHNFATNWGIVHNCQKNDDGRVMAIHVKDPTVKEELEHLLFHRKCLNMDQKNVWNIAKQLFIFGDFFWEVVIDPDNPKEGVKNLVPLPPETMYRIETTKGKLIEFQQSKEGPDYESLSKIDITQATDQDLLQAKAIRFPPEQIIHIRVGDDRKTFYPYGVSLMEAARGPAHQLRLMEDSAMVYRLSRAPERRVFYIDVQQIPPYKAMALVERMKDQLRKKKVPSRSGTPGASSVEERWHATAMDEDFWIPIRPNANTRVETLPGASNLGEIDDVIYFKLKLFTALHFPKNYMNNEDIQSTRISLSVQNVEFARLIERLQSYMEDAYWEVCHRHLQLLGYPEDLYDDLFIKFTPPSDWRELSRAEVVTNRLNNASNLKGSQLMSDYDILTGQLKYPEDEAKKMLERLKLQKLEDLRLQIIAQNPNYIGVGLPGPSELEVGTDVGGPNPSLPPDVSMAGPGQNMGTPDMSNPQGMNPPQNMIKYMSGDDQQFNGNPLPDPTEEDIKKYNMEIKNFEKEMDYEEIDDSERE